MKYFGTRAYETVHHTFWNIDFFRLIEVISFLSKWMVLKTVSGYVIWQQLNFSQATSQKPLKLIIFCADKHFQFFAIINRFIHHAVLAFQPMSQKWASFG